MDKKNKIIVIVGATASGKSRFGIKIAKHINSEMWVQTRLDRFSKKERHDHVHLNLVWQSRHVKTYS